MTAREEAQNEVRKADAHLHHVGGNIREHEYALEDLAKAVEHLSRAVKLLLVAG